MKKLKKMAVLIIITVLAFMSCDLMGEQGPQGEQGLQGEQGPQGFIQVENINLENIYLFLGESKIITANISPENATIKVVFWSSSDENVVSIELFTGKITANNNGKAIITAITADGGLIAESTVTVSTSSQSFFYGTWTWPFNDEIHRPAITVISSNKLRFDCEGDFYELNIDKWEPISNTDINNSEYPKGYAVYGTVATSKNWSMGIPFNFYLNSNDNQKIMWVLQSGNAVIFTKQSNSTDFSTTFSLTNSRMAVDNVKGSKYEGFDKMDNNP